MFDLFLYLMTHFIIVEQSIAPPRLEFYFNDNPFRFYNPWWIPRCSYGKKLIFNACWWKPQLQALVLITVQFRGCCLPKRAWFVRKHSSRRGRDQLQSKICLPHPDSLVLASDLEGDLVCDDCICSARGIETGAEVAASFSLPASHSSTRHTGPALVHGC